MRSYRKIFRTLLSLRPDGYISIRQDENEILLTPGQAMHLRRTLKEAQAEHSAKFNDYDKFWTPDTSGSGG